MTTAARGPAGSPVRAMGLALAVLLAAGASAAAQDPVPPDTVPRDTVPAPVVPRDTTVTPIPPVVRIPVRDTAVADSVPPPRPGWAFARSLVLPGWGQASYDAHFRGAVYYAGWAGSWFMNLKNFAKLDEAREMRAHRRTAVLDSLGVVAQTDTMIAAILADESRSAELDELILQDQVADDLRKLVDAREQQREDWIAWTIFWTLASGIDAFVTAHLSDFPDVISAGPAPGGGAFLSVEVPVPFRRP